MTNFHKKMDEIDNLQFFVDDEILLSATETLDENDCPLFDINFELSSATSLTTSTANGGPVTIPCVYQRRY